MPTKRSRAGPSHHVWTDWPLWKLKALHRAAKRTGFFRDPRDMIALRTRIIDKEMGYDPRR